MIGGHFHNRDMTDKAAGVDARLLVERGFEKGGRLDDTLHEETRCSLLDEFDGFCRRIVEVAGRYDFKAGNVEALAVMRLGGGRRYRLRIPDEYRLRYAGGICLGNGFQNRRFLRRCYRQFHHAGGGRRVDYLGYVVHRAYSRTGSVPASAPKPAWAKASSSPSPG